MLFSEDLPQWGHVQPKSSHIILASGEDTDLEKELHRFYETVLSDEFSHYANRIRGGCPEEKKDFYNYLGTFTTTWGLLQPAIPLPLRTFTTTWGLLQPGIPPLEPLPSLPSSRLSHSLSLVCLHAVGGFELRRGSFELRRGQL